MPLPVGNPYLDHLPEAYFSGHDSTGKVAAGEARVEAAGLRMSLALGQRLGMGAGITCWARSA